MNQKGEGILRVCRRSLCEPQPNHGFFEFAAEPILIFTRIPAGLINQMLAAGLLTCSRLSSLPNSWSVAERVRQTFAELTAAGTVTDSHRIPY